MSDQYRVTWVMDVDADGPVAAAEKALKAMRRDGTHSVAFEVAEVDAPWDKPKHVDLLEQRCAEPRCGTPLHLHCSGEDVEWLDTDGYALTCRGGGAVHRPAETVG